jgi:hypothetical protein
VRPSDWAASAGAGTKCVHKDEMASGEVGCVSVPGGRAGHDSTKTTPARERGTDRETEAESPRAGESPQQDDEKT